MHILLKFLTYLLFKTQKKKKAKNVLLYIYNNLAKNFLFIFYTYNNFNTIFYTYIFNYIYKEKEF